MDTNSVFVLNLITSLCRHKSKYSSDEDDSYSSRSRSRSPVRHKKHKKHRSRSRSESPARSKKHSSSHKKELEPERPQMTYEERM